MQNDRIRRAAMTLSFLLSALLLSACGGGGGGGNPVAALEGTWFGAYQTSSTDFMLRVDVGANGAITDIRQGSASLGLTGTIVHLQGNIFSFTLSDGTEGGFMTDTSSAHAGFLDELGSFGVLQKGASALPVYALGDAVGSWSGYSLMLDSGFNVTSTGASSATVSGGTPLNLSGSDMNGSFTGQIHTVEFSVGAYRGTWNNAGGDSGNLRAWLSVDKSFAATWACDGGVPTPAAFTDCTFAIWNKQ